jgi:hypothetical protein
MNSQIYSYGFELIFFLPLGLGWKKKINFTFPRSGVKKNRSFAQLAEENKEFFQKLKLVDFHLLFTPALKGEVAENISTFLTNGSNEKPEIYIIEHRKSITSVSWQIGVKRRWK